VKLARSRIPLSLSIALLGLAPRPAPACEAMIGNDYSEPPEIVEIDLDPARWHVASRTRDAVLARKEVVLAAETLADWTELVTWEVRFGAAGGDLGAQKDAFLAKLGAQCASLETKLVQRDAANLVFEWWHDGCYGQPPQHEISRLIAGTTGTHQLSYGRRGGRIDTAERARWLGWVSKVRVKGRLDGRKQSEVDRARRRIWAGDYSAALSILRPLAEKGDADAQEELARLYVEGWGVARDPAEALRWFERAAAQDHPTALYNLGRVYEKGLVVGADRGKALEMFRSAAQLGDAEAEGRMGYLSITAQPPDYAAARRWFERSAAHGHLDAVYWMGRLLDAGWGGERDVKRAFTLYERAAIQGSADAQYWLGRLYATGSGVEQDDRSAKKWLTRAIMQGQGEARAFYLYRYSSPSSEDGAARAE
jgi:uncharacterized protein